MPNGMTTLNCKFVRATRTTGWARTMKRKNKRKKRIKGRTGGEGRKREEEI
jgi:hypothetical protein